MKIGPILKHYSVVVLLLGITGLTCFFLFKASSFVDLVVFIMTVVSVCIALLAYHISIKTYVSIDAVNAISRMDGNVMENEGYRTNIAAQIRHFNAVHREQAATDVINYIKKLFTTDKNISGAHLADNIQEVIDIIVLLPFIVNSIDNKYAVRNRIEIDNLVAAINRKVDTFEKMSEGSCILMKESVKLIEAVFSYQKIKSVDKVSNCSLMDVRGTMLKNAVSQTVYYNYMGLLYLAKATDALLRELNVSRSKDQLYKIQTLQKLRSQYKTSCPEIVVIHLKMAMQYFTTASNVIKKDDIMWNSFIKFNMARVEFLLNILSNGELYPNWVDQFNSAINYRKHLNLMLKDILGMEECSFFQRAFIGEEHKARLLKIVCEIVVDQNITNIFGQVVVDKGQYYELIKSDYITKTPNDEFHLFMCHLHDILDYIQDTIEENHQLRVS